MVRLKDIAERSGVSLKTVSNVVNSYPHVSVAMRERVMKAIQETGYVPDETARRLASSKGPMPVTSNSRMRIGVLVRPGINKYDDPFHSRILTGIESEISATRNILAFAHSPSDFAADPMLFNYLGRQERLDGLITFVWHEEVQEFFSRCLPANIPMCSVNRLEGMDCLDINYAAGIRLMLEHLIQLGHRKIAYIGVTAPWYGQVDRRYTCFCDEMAQRRLPLPEYWHPEGGDFLEHDSGFRLATALLAAPELPTAVICASDILAISAMKAFLNAGIRIPEDISVTGFDNINLAEIVHPALTSVSVDQKQMGKNAVRLIIARRDDPTLPCQLRVAEPIPVFRESTAPASRKQIKPSK